MVLDWGCRAEFGNWLSLKASAVLRALDVGCKVLVNPVWVEKAFFSGDKLLSLVAGMRVLLILE